VRTGYWLGSLNEMGAMEGLCLGGRILKSIESAVGGRAGNSSLNADKWPALVNTVMKL
jgi:hypothetical protein